MISGNVPSATDRTYLAQVWSQVCHHLDGLAIGTTVESLDAAGVFDALLSADAPTPVAEIAQSTGYKTGYTNLAFRLLALQGFVERTGNIPAGETRVALTPAGREWAALRVHYAGAAAKLADAIALLEGLQDNSAPPPVTLPDSPLVAIAPERIRLHVWGPYVAAAMTGLARGGVLAQLNEGPDSGLPAEALKGDPVAVDAGLGILAAQNWAARHAGHWSLTPVGKSAVEVAPQYFYPSSYFATLAAVPDLMRGHDPRISRGDDGTEGHVDRELDIAFSGIVFARTCREPLFDTALSMFDTQPIEIQPRAIVDCGAGDGTLLCELYRAIVERTERGRRLDAAPLTMVGVEYNPVAERVLAERLDREGIPHIVFSGDVGNPAAIAERLREHGLTADDVLHVSKSVVHNRAFEGAGTSAAAASSRAAFSAPNGELIDAARLEADLQACLEKWREQLGRHGMIIIEAHVVGDAMAAARVGRSIMTSLEANHGYSHQYLVEAEVHRRAAEAAGLTARHRHDIGVEFAGAPILTVDHFLA